MRSLVSFIVLLSMATSTFAELSTSVDFEGGSAEIESVDQEKATIRMTPGTRPDRGWACWWYVRVDGVTPGLEITIDLGVNSKQKLSAGWMMPGRATFSTDGKTWQHTKLGKRSGSRILYKAKVDGKQVWFAWGPPFTPKDSQALVDRIAKDHDFATAFELCKTRDGRSVPALRVRDGKMKDEDRFGVWINARQHAWESGSSWVCKGLVDWLVSDDAQARTLRHKADIHIVPIMDIDNTAVGAGGKNQKPHDHNRDWSKDATWHSVQAAIQHITKLNEAGRFELFLDLHNPGPGDRQPFYFIAPDSHLSPLGKANLHRFIKIAGEEIKGPLKLSTKPKVSGSSYDKLWKRISKNWVMAHCAEHVVAVTLETSWNTPASNTEGYETVGRQQGLALERYFRDSPRKQVAE